MRRAFLVVLLFIAGASSAMAQDVVLNHYRAYRAALDRNDLAVAESEAAQALQASETRDGAGGRTAVLALNLATARLAMGHGNDAFGPAHRALDIAHANGGSGVDPVLAQLVAARADLAADRPQASSTLGTALRQAQSHQEWIADVYAGAVDLGHWAIEHAQFDVAREAWGTAATTSQGAGTDPTFANGYAKIQFARAIIMTTTQQRLSRADAFTAQEALRVAVGAFYPSVRNGIPPNGPNAAQRTYAEARAWQAALSALLASENVSIPWPISPHHSDAAQNTPSPEGDPRPVCDMELVAEPMPTYPRRAQNDLIVGAVVLYYESGEDGSLTRHDVLAAVGPVFPSAVQAVASHWRMRSLPGSGPNCRMNTHGFQNITFSFR